MRTRFKLVLCFFLFLSALINSVWAAGESFADQFLGGPLLVLASVLVIDAIAFVYHKIRK